VKPPLNILEAIPECSTAQSTFLLTSCHSCRAQLSTHKISGDWLLATYWVVPQSFALLVPMATAGKGKCYTWVTCGKEYSYWTSRHGGRAWFSTHRTSGDWLLTTNWAVLQPGGKHTHVGVHQYKQTEETTLLQLGYSSFLWPLPVQKWFTEWNSPCRPIHETLKTKDRGK
jgi:hypothetical protein